uniref:RGS domain-containing protein n=1 Tax=Bursaphelenchus xylophilus TaxID=6326 RepID=A0A1I7SMX2_BURXY
IIHLFRSQFLRSISEAELVANSATAQRFTVSQYLIQVRDCDHGDSARCNDPMGILRRAFRYLKPKISHFEAFLQRKLNVNVEFDFFATYLVTVRNHRVFSGLMGSSFAQGEEGFAQFELLRRIFSDDDKKLR